MNDFVRINKRAQSHSALYQGDLLTASFTIKQISATATTTTTVLLECSIRTSAAADNDETKYPVYSVSLPASNDHDFKSFLQKQQMRCFSSLLDCRLLLYGVLEVLF